MQIDLVEDLFSRWSPLSMKLVLQEPMRTPMRTPRDERETPAWYATPTPGASAKKKVERWLKDVEREASSIAKDSPPSVGQERLAKELEFESNAATPDEPSLSSLGKYFQLKPLRAPQRTATPEQPALSSVSRTEGGDEEHSHTPDEPQLSLTGRSVVVEPGAQFREERAHTPEEPLLPWRGTQLLPQRFEATRRPPEEPALRSAQPPLENEPISPQLSDITRKILNASSFRFCRREETDLEAKTPQGNRYLSPDDAPDSPHLSELTCKILGLK